MDYPDARKRFYNIQDNDNIQCNIITAWINYYSTKPKIEKGIPRSISTTI